MSSDSDYYPAVRPPRESLLILGLLVAGCLLGGTLIGLAAGSFITRMAPDSAAEEGVPALSTATASPQVSVLLLGVDSVTASQPTLEACWVLTFAPGTSTYYLIGFSPAHEASLPGAESPRSLADIYAIDRQIARGSSMFTRDALEIIMEGLMRPRAEVLFDRQMLATAVDLLGGITVEGERLSGPALLARQDALPREAAEARLAFQALALTAITEAVKQRAWSPDALHTYLDLGQQMNPGADWFLTLARAELPLGGATFIVKPVSLTVGEASAP